MALSTLAPSSSSSSSRHHVRWRTVLSRWSPAREKRKMLMLPTVMAAATEKVVMHRRSPCQQPQQIKSEDLTASQFAHMAGIQIHHDEHPAHDDHLDDDDDDTASLTHGYGHKQVVTTSVSMSRSCSDRGGGAPRRPHPRIWDPAFWQQQQQQQQHDDETAKMHPPQPACAMMTPLHSYASTASSASSYSNPSSTCSSPPTLLRSGPSVIRKGRFKIVLGQDQELQHDGHVDGSAKPQYVEWRRKRACTT